MIEEPLQFGDGGRLFGILTTPDRPADAASVSRIFVFLNAGLVPRAGPHRLHVRLARELAEIGIHSLRIDFAGRGDSLPPAEGPDQKTVAADFVEIMRLLESELGDIEIVLVGLCSGADNAIRLALQDRRVTGLVLLDPVCDQDPGFRSRALRYSTRALLRKCTTPSKYLPWIKRCIAAMFGRTDDADGSVDSLSLRDLPTAEQTRDALATVRERNGKVLAVFTQYALDYYNQLGQMGDVLGLDGYDEFCTERFWPQVEHTYPIEQHRRQLIDAIRSWAS